MIKHHDVKYPVKPRSSASRGAKRNPIPVVLLFVLAAVLAVGGIAYANRVRIRDAVARLTAPTLPAEEAYRPPQVEPVVPQPDTQTPQGSATGTVVEPSKDSLPIEKRLAVPFTSQAPTMNWDLPYQEACEEASILMVAGYYQGDRGVYDKDTADRMIVDLVAFVQQQGFEVDTTAAETARIVEARWPDLDAQVLPMTGPESVKEWIARGVPVILPADGKALPNPHFRNGGPPYHMLVVRGYTDEQFITNDPGTRNGENFLYTYRGLLDAVHDWNGGDVPNGDKVMLIIQPKKQL